MNSVIEEGRRDCPLCEGSNTLNVTHKNDKLLLQCHRCVITDRGEWFKQMLAALGVQPGTNHHPPARKTSKPKPTHSEAAAEARKIWEMAKPADPKHAYLAKKGIHPHGIRQDENGQLLLTARDIYGNITTTQTIDQNGNKRFMSGGKKNGSSFILNNQTIADRVYICEGFATAASVQEASGETTICAFDAGNLQPVAEALRSRYPELKLILCGDDDRFPKVTGDSL